MKSIIKTWEIVFIENHVAKSTLVYGDSAIIEENTWKNANPNKEFIQISLYK